MERRRRMQTPPDEDPTREVGTSWRAAPSRGGRSRVGKAVGLQECGAHGGGAFGLPPRPPKESAPAGDAGP
eukprot:7600150-Pyramimonas_sp.AAC.1